MWIAYTYINVYTIRGIAKPVNEGGWEGGIGIGLSAQGNVSSDRTNKHRKAIKYGDDKLEGWREKDMKWEKGIYMYEADGTPERRLFLGVIRTVCLRKVALELMFGGGYGA